MLKNGGKCLEAMVIASDGKDSPFHLILTSVQQSSIPSDLVNRISVCFLLVN